MKSIKKLNSCATLHNNQGFALIASLMALLILTAVGVLVFTLSTQDIRVSMRIVSEKKAFNTAQARIHKFKADLSSPTLFPNNPHTYMHPEKPDNPTPTLYPGGVIYSFDRILNTFDCDTLDTDIDDPASMHNNCRAPRNLEILGGQYAPPRRGFGLPDGSSDNMPGISIEMRAIGKDGNRASVAIQYGVRLQ